MEGTFALNEPGWYEVKIAEENNFINDNLDSTEYGIYYSVGFVGDAETFLWQTKTAPVVGEKYWGYLEKAKSGKSVKFKWDKKNAPENTPDSTPSTQTKQQSSNNKSITLGLVWKVLIGIQGVPEDDEQFAQFYETVNAHVSELLRMGEKLN